MGIRDAHSLLQKFVHLLTDDIYMEEVVDLLIEIMQLPKVTTWASIRQHLQDYIGSPWFMTRLSDSIRGEYTDSVQITHKAIVNRQPLLMTTLSMLQP